MAYNETTEWEDRQVDAGNYKPSKKKVDYTAQEINKLNQFLEKNNLDNVDNKNADNLSDDDIFGEDDYELQLKEKIKQKMMLESAKINYQATHAIHLESLDEYGHRILKDKTENRVILLVLYQDHISKSVKFTDEFSQYVLDLAKTDDFIRQNGSIIVYKMIATDCIPHFEDKDTPSILLFKDGQIIKKFICCFDMFTNSGGSLVPEKCNTEIIDAIKKILKYVKAKKEFKEETAFEPKNDREYYWKK